MARKGTSAWELAAIVGLIALLGSLVVPAPGNSRAAGRSWLGAWLFAGRDVRDCRRNLKDLGTASEMYSTDYSGHYERRLSRLAPHYLKRLPTCPAAGSETYSAGYTSASNPDAYTVVCRGWNHRPAGLPGNAPEFDFRTGCDER